MAAKEGTPRGVTPGDYLVDRCQERLARHLTHREQRDIRSQAFPQVRDCRSNLKSADWSSLGDGDQELVAKCVASLLLNPKTTWFKLIPVDTRSESKNQYNEFQTVRRACVNFARQANLKLPSKRVGRRPGSYNTPH